MGGVLAWRYDCCEEEVIVYGDVHGGVGYGGVSW